MYFNRIIYNRGRNLVLGGSAGVQKRAMRKRAHGAIIGRHSGSLHVGLVYEYVATLARC